jgi:choline dehydrogenase-like flavoprotein
MAAATRVEKERYDYVVVGSGAGGGTLVRELTLRGKEVLCIERGPEIRKVGGFWDCRHFWDFQRLPDFLPRGLQKIPLLPPRTDEGIILWRGVAAGGTTTISAGNGARCMEPELAALGIDLTAELAETEEETGLVPLAESLLSGGARAIRGAAAQVGVEMTAMPKFVDRRRCVRCHKCLYGCSYGAKWDVRPWLGEARERGAEFLFDTTVTGVCSANGKATGVTVQGPGGARTIGAGCVILAAGGMATPVILQRSGIAEAGSGFFLDLMWNTYGISDDASVNLDREPVMSIVGFAADKGFLISPFMNHARLGRLQEMAPWRARHASRRVVGIMTKINDDANGRVFPSGRCSKPLTERDRARLREGARLARAILTRAGVRPETLFESRLQGAHPGGTAAIGTVVDTELRTRIENLYVCDASVFPAQAFPEAERLPPIVTIVALAKRLARRLA